MGLLGYAAGRQFAARALANPAGHGVRDNIYTRLGVRPFINANIPFPFLSAALEWPEVRRLTAEASHYFVNIVDLQKAVGKRLAEISGAASGMVTSGAALGSLPAMHAAVAAAFEPAARRQSLRAAHGEVGSGGARDHRRGVRAAAARGRAVHFGALQLQSLCDPDSRRPRKHGRLPRRRTITWWCIRWDCSPAKNSSWDAGCAKS